ncbi:hypothetical protein Tco_1527705, partial [Tanacetum coccineum]
QILADFLMEKPDDTPGDISIKETPKEVWALFTDGSSYTDGSSAGLILTSLERTEFTYALRFQVVFRCVVVFLGVLQIGIRALVIEN